MDIRRQMWGALMVRGVIAVLFGLAAILWWGISARILVYLFAAYVIADGLFAFIAGGQSRIWLLLAEGLVGLAAGLAAIFWPQIALLVLIYIAAFWAILTGLVEMIIAVELRKVIQKEWLMFLGGLVSIILGVLLFIYPNLGILAFIWVIGIYAIVFGASLIGLAFRLLGLKQAA